MFSYFRDFTIFYKFYRFFTYLITGLFAIYEILLTYVNDSGSSWIWKGQK